MKRSSVVILLASFLLLLAAGGYYFFQPELPTGRVPMKKSAGPEVRQSPKAAYEMTDPALDQDGFEETQPPAGLPVITWGKRGHFPVIRRPWYVSAQEGDELLAADEPVLGLIIGAEKRAYSTNQLCEHEMVIDKIGGIPILVTY